MDTSSKMIKHARNIRKTNSRANSITANSSNEFTEYGKMKRKFTERGAPANPISHKQVLETRLLASDGAPTDLAN